MATAPKGGTTAKPETSVEADVAELRAEVAALTRQLKSLGEKSASTARKAANEGVEQLRAKGEARLSDLRETADDVEERVSKSVREKPITSLAIAAGVGFLFAMLARR